MARKRDAERMAARRKVEAARRKVEATRSGPIPNESSKPIIVEETAHVDVAETEKAADRSISEDREEKRAAEDEVNSEENPVDKRPRLEESDVTAERIAELGRRQHDAVERIGRLQSEVEGQRNRAEFEAMRATMESVRAEAEKERAQIANQLKSEVEERANAIQELLKLAKEALAKLEPELAESKAAKEKADSEASETFKAGKSAALVYKLRRLGEAWTQRERG
ncbi:uncharacterized protein LOC114311996 [Camellia sinensis]|uniref:uncharacterized protein LOC114311996 n=1 Tax=Camellia sinensis TaxID=4442 RepID=UPI001036B857|nr:uncharacterized protein LOC114311996 [Camellia sinensis]